MRDSQDAGAISRASPTASSARTCSMPTIRRASGSRPKGRRSRPAPARRWSASGWCSPARPTASCGAAWRRRRCSAAATAARRWALVEGLWNVPERAHWEGGAGGLCLHSICPWPGDPKRLAVGISSAGVWLTEDGGRRWRRSVDGPGAALSARGGAGRHARLLRPQHAPRAAPAGDALHAVPRRRLPLRRRRRELDRHRHRTAGCPPTSASRWPSTPTIPTARSSSRWRRTPTA